MKLTIILFCLTLLAMNLQAQQDWQQKIDYQIYVKLDDKAHTLTGNETFVYHNNSPESLDKMFIHVWPNAYKDGSTALGKQLYNDGETLLTFGPDSVKGGIENLNFSTNGTPIPWEFDTENPDIVILTLDNPIPPGGQMSISTPFFVRIPSGEISRLGHVGQSYQITQWYPKPAVYDKNGWNPIPYLNQGEFYSDYGTFDVSITLPENYVLGATGDCQTPSEIDFLNDLASKTQNSIESYTDKKKMSQDAFPPSSETFKTVRYTQQNVHDFAWFADKRYLVLKGQVELPESKRMVTSWAMFTPRNANLWKNAIEYINDGTYYYSKWNGDYPYNNVTAVDGTISAGGGMEYPNITVIGNSSSAIELEIVIVHEVGHNWFYGILGSNERVHGWMDEGMNTLNELRYMYTKYPNNTNLSDMILNGAMHFDHLSHYDMADVSFVMVAKLGEDQPIETHSADFTSMNYGAVMYMKTGLIFNYLKEYLGDTLFDKCMRAYYETWKFKHPDPADMQEVFEKVSERDLDWMFHDLIKTTKHLDAKLCSVHSKNGETTIKVANKGQVNGPIEVTGYVDGKAVKTEWADPGDKTTLVWPMEVDMVKVNASHREPEMNRTNDYWDNKGLFGKVEPLKLEFLIGDNEPDRTSTFWTPVIAGNIYDKLMLGVAVHNNGIPFKRFQYCMTPLYSFGGKRISGIAELSIGMTPARNFKTSRIGISVKSFKNDTTAIDNSGYYFTLQPYWQAKVGNRKAASPWSSDLILQSMYRLDVLRPSQTELIGGFFKYNFRFNRPDHKLLISLRTDYLTNPVNGDALGRNSIELHYKFRYMRKNKERWLELRHYTGANYLFDFAHTSSLLPFTLSLSGASGIQDLFFEDYFFGRSEVTGFNSQKRMENMGGFKSTSFYGTTSRAISAFNFYIQTPIGPKIFGAFADYGLFSSSVNNKIGTAFNAGLALRLGTYFGIYFPVYSTQNLIDSTPGSGYGSRIRFCLKLNIIKQPLNLGSLI